MTNPEPSIRINVDPTNPGEFFACCGLLEVADRLWSGAEGWFEDSSFCVAATDRQECGLMTLLTPLVECSAFTERELAIQESLSVQDAGNAEHNDVKSEATSDKECKTDPVILGQPIAVSLNWWLRFDGSENLFKTWAANATAQQMFRKWQAPLRSQLPEIKKAPERLLAFAARIQGSYGFDSLLGWDGLEVGFSLNEHNRLKKLPTRPAVELLGAVGLQTFFPDLDEKSQRVRYATWRIPLLPNVARVAALGYLPSVLKSHFRTSFTYRGAFKGLDFARPIRGEEHD
jgi:CRISPR-associated protein Csx14